MKILYLLEVLGALQVLEVHQIHGVQLLQGTLSNRVLLFHPFRLALLQVREYQINQVHRSDQLDHVVQVLRNNHLILEDQPGLGNLVVQAVQGVQVVLCHPNEIKNFLYLLLNNFRDMYIMRFFNYLHRGDQEVHEDQELPGILQNQVLPFYRSVQAIHLIHQHHDLLSDLGVQKVLRIHLFPRIIIT